MEEFMEIDAAAVSNNEKPQDLEPKLWSPEEILKNYILGEQFADDCFIPSPVLKETSKPFYLGPDIILALQKIGMKYNNLLKKHQVMNSETEILKAKIDKCVQECQPRYEALEKKHNECQYLIPEIEMLQSKCEALSKNCLQECEPKYEALKKILAEETAERKGFYNELIELRGNIRVFCRCRPLSNEETSNSCTSVIEFDPSKDTELQVTCADSSRKIFKFDHVFSPKDDQEAVFSETLPIVKSVMDGFNVCIFAYGQTGTGKTFTMEGTPECRGVNYKALEELFRIMKERIPLMHYEFSFSMLEVYNEKIRDLLADNSDPYSKKLDVKQSAEGTQEVPGLAEIEVCSIDEVWEMHKSGGRNRAVGSTNANELSSRSHCLVRVTIKGENLVTGERSKSFLWLVDLAGSERLGRIEAEGERLKESQFINKSLSALGDVISALASKSSHIPYRNSKLTHLLQSSLGGDCKTLMFAQISPSLADLGETLCTLNFASRVRGVEHGPARKQSDPVDNFKLKQMVEKLRLEEKEVNRLNESLQMMQIKYASRENIFRTLQEKIRESEQACKNYQQKIKDLENQLVEEKKARTQLAANETTRSFQASSKQRPPLARITNRLPPLAHHKTAKTAFENKENAYSRGKDVTKGFTTKPLGRARRISLSPVVCSMPNNKRRASIATELGTLALLPEKQHMNHANFTTKLSQLRIPRRRSVATLTPFQESPKDNGKCISSFKYPSTLQLQTMWRSKFPNLPSPLH
ncbi:kinesin-like protein KIN-14J isoform X2 [Phalaenopsis equestris]|nr:kinesin-like protein KIN-14J isoform X2 [Phalaenopsis equestris]